MHELRKKVRDAVEARGLLCKFSYGQLVVMPDVGQTIIVEVFNMNPEGDGFDGTIAEQRDEVVFPYEGDDGPYADYLEMLLEDEIPQLVPASLWPRI